MVSIIPKILGGSNVFVMYSKITGLTAAILSAAQGTVCMYGFLQGSFDNVSLLTNLDFLSVFPSVSFLFLNTFGHLGTPSASQEGEL